MQFKISVLIFIAAVSFQALSKTKAQQKSVEDELQFRPGDEAGNEVKALKAELLISRNDEKAQKQLEKLTRKYTGTALEPSLRLRMAELYMRRSKTSTFFELNKDNTDVVKFTPNVVKKTSSRDWITKAINTYDLIEKKFTHFRDMDLVLFNSAFARQMLGRDKEAISRYERVIEDHSGSPLVPDSHLAIGEYYFSSKKFQAAFDEFQKIRKYPEARVYPYGLYKGAWALYNLHRGSEALTQMEEVVRFSKTEEGAENRLDLTREALDDMVVFYEDVKPAGDAVAYFRKQAGDAKAGGLVLKLGRLYQRHGKFKNLELAFVDLLNHLPMAEERPEIHADLMEAYHGTNRKKLAVVQLETLSDICVESSDWAQKQSLETRNNCWNKLEESGKKYASKWHKRLRKLPEPEPELDVVTARAYEALLKHERKIAGEDKIRFNYAELLFQLKYYRRASVQYAKVAVVTGDPKLRHDGSYGALLSLEKDVKDKWSDEDEREFARLAALYLKLNPKGEHVTDIRFKKAFIAYDKNRYDEAAPQLKELAKQYPKTDRGTKAATLYLDSLNVQKKFALLRDESLMFARKYPFDAKTKADFEKIHQQASFTVIQDFESQKRYKDAIDGYLTFVKLNPRSEFADKALYNAIRSANLMGDLQLASQLIERLLHEYPQTQYRVELTKSLITIYEAQAQLSHAAEAHLRVSELEPKEKWPHILRAADYFALDNKWSQANRYYQTILDKAPERPEWPIAKERTLTISEKTNAKGTMVKILDQIFSGRFQPQASLAGLKLTQRAFESGDDAFTFKIGKRVVSMKSDKNASTWAIAQARLLLGKVLEKEFDRASVKARPERLAMVLAIKTEKLDKVQKAYQETMAMGDRSTAVEALMHLGRCYAKYAQALHSIEAPSDAPEADKQKFLSELENLAIPLEEKAADTLSLALKQAKDLKLHDGIIPKIQAEINRMSKRQVASESSFELVKTETVLPVVK